MSSCPNAQSTEVGYLSHQNGFPATESLTEGHESILRLDEDEDEDEDEDVDFNPFLKGTLSPEASSSLSSEIEGLDGEVVDSSRNTVETAGINSLNVACEVQNCSVGDSEHGEEEIVMQTTVSSEGASENEFEKTDPGNAKKRMSGFISKPAIETIQEKDDGSSSGTDVNDVTVGELSNTTDIQKPTIDLDDEEEDAICKRTRARYSLASFTLDELETFLQETDDDDDLQNVDDEEEYKKFLAAVLQGGEDDDQSTKENENADDEDEDNDADFEIELEELLESDVDENTRDKTKKEYGGAGRRPKTRQIRCQNSSGQCKKKNLGQTKRPLRPLLPVLPNGPISSFSTQDSRTLMPGTAPSCLSLTVEGRCINGFAPHQIGQLHCLIHEHVQLLIQVYSLCVLDHSRQHIASQVQRLIFEMLHKRDEVMAWKSAPYPTTCFVPSVPTEGPKSYPKQSTLASSLTLDARGVCSSNNHMAVSPNISPSEGRCEHVPNRQLGFLQNLGGSFWVPSISGRVLSVLDVAPLSLVGRYMHEVDTAVQENRRRYMDTSSDTRFEREPLYPLPNFPVCAQDNCEVVSETGSSAVNVVQSSSSQQPPKKSLAAAIVESTKKQSVALVPREIAKLAQRFFPLSNPELFPHKPPPAAIANRVLFTDAEDELLALGLMEYNTDWKAIQQRFLPCKSKHQIFVRQKNRCSSKAPENPIKAVRRMKTSPLTAQEIACIQEGLKAYKYDWMSVWQFIVPHRDPSLLPRQWRIACGTQKSYKVDEAKKAKRRLYESERRKQKNADLSSWQNSSEKEDCQAEKSGGENNSADGYTDNVGETYVHEAFLADWRPGTFSGEKNLHSGTLLREAIHEWENDYGHKEAPQTQTGNMYQFPSVSKYPQNPSSQITGVRHFVPSTTKTNHCVSHMTSNTSKSKFYYRPYRARRTSGAHLVKLAPDLPPVNLPPSVRVVSQSSFKGSLCGASSMVASAGGGCGASTTDNLVSQLSQVGRSGTSDAMTAGQNISRSLKDSVTSSRPEDSRTDKDKCLEEGGDTDSDLQMHPLLFQAPEDGRLPYYPLNCSNNNCNTFSFFSGNHPQLHLSLSHNPHQENDAECSVKSLKKSNLISRGIDFHPLMQRTDYVRGVTVTTCSTASLSVVSGGKCAQVHYPSDTVRTEFLVNTDPQDLGPKPFSPDEKANELDLEINLSSTSKKEKALKSRDVTVHNVVKSRTTAPDSGTLMITKSANSPIYRHAEDSSANGSKLVSGGQTLVIPSNSISRYNVDDMRDLAQPDIEMEQEELSDSDEENEENVEFECEEMDDSEGEEGSACEQIAEMQNKDVPSSAMKRPATEDASNSQGDIHSLELGFTNQGKDDASNSSWLSLDSCAPDRSSHMMSKYEESMISKGLVAKDLASSRPSRSCRKAKPNTREVVAQKQAVDMAQQLSLGPLAIPIVRKPRKRVCRTNTCLNIGLTVENSSSDG